MLPLLIVLLLIVLVLIVALPWRWEVLPRPQAPAVPRLGGDGQTKSLPNRFPPSPRSPVSALSETDATSRKVHAQATTHHSWTFCFVTDMCRAQHGRSLHPWKPWLSHSTPDTPGEFNPPEIFTDAEKVPELRAGRQALETPLVIHWTTGESNPPPKYLRTPPHARVPCRALVDGARVGLLNTILT